MSLVEEGRIGLDDPLSRWFPQSPPAWQAISVRHLLTHTSGIPGYDGTPGSPTGIDYRRDYTEDELARFAMALPPAFAPGSRWQYGDTGYVLLGILVRRASGRFYGDLLRERFFAPLGMAQARVISEADIVPHRAAGYRLQDGELKNQAWVAPSLNTTADGSLQMSLDDMIAWDRGVRERRILSEASWRRMATPVMLDDGTRFPHGFGWALETVGGQTRLQHDGEWQGFRSYYARDLGPDLSVIVLANASHADARRIGGTVAGLWHPALAPRAEAAEPGR
jgi:CubicO group peptidase (beta-lactamase class C family)